MLRALALLPHEALNSLRQQYLPVMIRVLRLSRLVQWESQAIAQKHQGPLGYARASIP